MYRKYSFLFVVFMAFVVAPVLAAEKAEVPEPLKPWVSWVLHDHERELLCTPNYNNYNNLTCNWPSSLDLQIMADQGTFKQAWHLEHEGWIQLPGDSRIWPENVAINTKPATALDRGGIPMVKLPAGTYNIAGSFSWRSRPEFLQVNPSTGLLTLSIDGRKIDFPSLDDGGRVWLHAKGQVDRVIEDRLQIQGFRLIDDQIPARIILRLNLDVAGSAREVLLGAPFDPDSFIPVSLASSLPSRLEKDGRIRLQVRPGQWSITLTVRHVGPLASLLFTKPDESWPDEEIWVFSKQNNRIVEIRGLEPIDPQQTSLPPEWRSLPAYRVINGKEMVLEEIKRGDPVPAPDQLSLQRNLWLRFDGSGYTIQDQISGKKTSDWRLEMAPPILLGRVAIDGAEQFITKREGSPNTGIELRKGMTRISADSEYKGPISRIPATGWDHDFQKVGARLFLPPGYRLLHARGIDNIPSTWLNRWSLLDIFIVLIFTIAMARLFSKPMAATGLLTMVLLYHEPEAPRWIWLAILAGIALLRNLPPGNFLKAVRVYNLAAFLILIIIAVPFSVKQLRVGLYPQLEKPWQAMSDLSLVQPAAFEPVVQESMVEPDMVSESVSELARLEDRAAGKMKSLRIPSSSPARSYYPGQQVAQYDPAMINQTGPGIPAWQWNTVQMSWSGPVARDQQINLTLIGPGANLFLAFVRVGLLLVLALVLIGVRFDRLGGWQFPDRKALLVVPLLLAALLLAGPAKAAEIPSPEMFNELRRRLLEKDDCFPNCADIPSMAISIDRTSTSIEFPVVAQVRTAIPLPGDPRHWLPGSVVIDGLPARAIYRTGQGLWIITPEGAHTVRLNGRNPTNNTLQLSLPLKPHRLKLAMNGWTAEGLHPDGTIDNQLQFKRIAEKQGKASQILDSGVLPPFALVRRNLLLGLEWKIETIVQRLSPGGSAIIMEYPLLPGEAVLTGWIKVKDGRAQINIDSQGNELRFESILEKDSLLSLRHAENNGWTEIWQVDASPIFHLEYEGIPVILHQTGDRWTPMWHPWPGEELQLKISRPAGVAGQTITIDKSRLEVSPGQRSTDCTLDLSLRSSQGGRHTIVLPPDSQLQEVLINGQVQSIRQEGRDVPLPINPGSQSIILKWRLPEGITASYRTPLVDLGLPGANANIDLHLPDNRWPLVVYGPTIGPAILFWSVVLIIILIAYGLARSNLTHLRFYQWFLLGIGMSQSNLPGALLVVGWLIAIEFRKKVPADMDKSHFNLMQFGLAALTFLALSSLIFAISGGLLGHPDMNIVGNGSYRNLLRWYQDYTAGSLPRAWLLSISIFWYRLAMLAWALWISFTLIRILKYGWQAYSSPVLWHQTPGKTKIPDPPPQKDTMARAGKNEVDLSDDLQVEE